MHEIMTTTNAPLAVAQSPENAAQSFIRMAMDRGTPVGEMTELVKVWKDLVADSRKTSFDAGMTKFKADCPPMPRGHASHLTRVNAAGVTEKSRYSDMADIAKTIAPCLRDNGLSYEWEETELVEIGGQPYYRAHIRIRHESGYSERKSGPPIPLGAKNNQSPQMQAAAVVTTAQRLALRSAFGLWSIDQDEENSAMEAKPDTITPEQADELAAIIDGDAGLLDRMLKGCGVEEIADIPAAKFEYVRSRLVKTVEAKGKK